MIPNPCSFSVLAVAALAIVEIPKEIPHLANFLQAPPAVRQAPLGQAAGDSRAVMGVAVVPADPALRSHLGIATEQGVVLMNVAPGQPADRAGFRRFDVLLAIDDQPVGSREDLRKILDAKSPGEKILVAARRGVEELRIEVVLAAAPASEGSAAGLFDELVAQDKSDEERRQQMFAELEAAGRTGPALLEELRRREIEVAARQALMQQDRDRLTTELESLRENLGQLGYLGSKPALEEGAARLESLKELLAARSRESEATARAARDHLAALQDALHTKVDRLNDAQELLSERAEELRDKIESELRARAEVLAQKFGADEAAALRDEATRLAEEAKRAMLDARERLFTESDNPLRRFEQLKREEEKAARFGDLARQQALRAEADAYRKQLEHAETEGRQTIEQHGAIEHRLAAIEERLARIEEMLGKLVKRDSQN